MASTRDRSTLARLGRARQRVRRAVLARRRLLAAILTAAAVATGLHAVAAPPPESVQVLVAGRDLPAGAVLGTTDVAAVEFAPGSVPDGATTDPVGRTLAAPLRRGEPVTDVRLVGAALTSPADDSVAVPVRLPDAEMVGLLTVGDRIDLIATDPEGSGASVVAADVPVLALPQSPGGQGEQTGALAVVGVPSSAVTRLADSGVRQFLTYAFAR